MKSLQSRGPVAFEDAKPEWSRRGFLGTALTSLGVMTAAPALGYQQGDRRRDDNWYDLQIPEITNSSLPELVCAATTVDLGDGKLRGALTYNGMLPGPTWEARTGETVTTRLVNKLSERTITHWHGLIVDEPNDGGPRIWINPNETYDYSFPIIQRASLNFYHPHAHMLTGKQVCLGMAGAFVIRDDEEDALNLPAGPYEIPLVIRDASFDNRGNLAYNPTSSGFTGKFPLVNGTLKPTTKVDKGRYRLRILNGSNARVFRLALSNGAAFSIIGNDGGLLTTPRSVNQVDLGMGERLDILVTFAALTAGQAVTLRCLLAKWDLVQFVGSGNPGYSYPVPTTLSSITPLVDPGTVTRFFSFDGMSRINGKQYEMDRIDFRVPRGVVEGWRFRSGGNAPHTVHVHGASFQVISRTGGRGRLYPWESGWKDTVLLGDRETVDVLIRFDHYAGLYVMHCHQLEHEDMGMMTNFEVY